MRQDVRNNTWAFIGMVSAVVPTIGLLLLLIGSGLIFGFAKPDPSWGVFLEVMAYALGCFTLVAYPLAFVLGIIGLRQIARSGGTEKGKALAWIAIALPSGYFVITIGMLISTLISGPSLPAFPPLDNQIPRTPVSAGDRFNFPIFSIRSPQGSGWSYQLQQNGIIFGVTEKLDEQKTIYSERSNIAIAKSDAVDAQTNYSREQFKEFACARIRSLQEADGIADQQGNCDWWVESTFDCVRLDGRYEDHGDKNNPYSPPLIVDGHSVVCRHPDFYNAMIFLHYSQRGPEGSIRDDVLERADAFFMSMGMSYPSGTETSEPVHESSGEIRDSQPGTNLAYHKVVRTSSALSDFPSGKAVDGIRTNWWGAGARPPQWVEIDLGANYVIGEVSLLTSQSPAGRTIHNLSARGAATNDEFLLVHTFDQFTSDNQDLTFKLPEPLQGVRYIRIETEYSPSWVGWREIEVIADR